MYRYVNPVIVYMSVEKETQTRRSATDVEQITLSSPRDLVYQPCHFLGSKMRFGEPKVFCIPEVPLIRLDGVPGVASGNRVLAHRWVVHDHLQGAAGLFCLASALMPLGPPATRTFLARPRSSGASWTGGQATSRSTGAATARF